MSKVALIKGNNRYQNVFLALKEIEKEVEEKVKSKDKIIIKPNFTTVSNQLAATHVEAVKAVLDFLKPLTSQKIIVAEGASMGKTEQGFKNYDYLKLKKDYNIDFFDLNQDNFTEKEIFSRNLKPLKVGVAETILKSDFIISVCPPKTHDVVVVTLSLKNLLVGSLEQKSKIHQGYKAINLSLAKLTETFSPHLSVIDGFLGMEGEGPVHGSSVKMRIALAGTDFLSTDIVGANLMGFNISQIGYLYYCNQRGLGEGNLDNIDVLGNTSLDKVKKKFKPHSTFEQQLDWR